MLPEIVFSIVNLLFCLATLIIIPICTFAFWDETKDYIFNYEAERITIGSSDPKTDMIILWICNAITACLYEIPHDIS